MSNEIYNLEPTNGRASFYGKAKVIVKGSMRYLRSYDTIVAGKDVSTGKVYRYWDGMTNTTAAHIKSFCGLDARGFRKLPLTERDEITITL